jgi:hypothetical protein
MLAHVSWTEWVQFVAVLAPMLAIGLTALSHVGFIAKNTAYTSIVNGALHIVAQIETTLKGNPSITAAQAIQDGMAELRQVYDAEFKKLGVDPRVSDEGLILLFQRLSRLLPAGEAALANGLLGSFLSTGGGAGTVSGGSATVALAARRPLFIRTVGRVSFVR